jgi:hypothetical protein
MFDLFIFFCAVIVTIALSIWMEQKGKFQEKYGIGLLLPCELRF